METNLDESDTIQIKHLGGYNNVQDELLIDKWIQYDFILMLKLEMLSSQRVHHLQLLETRII